MRTKLRLFLDWGIRFGEPYTVEEKAHRKVVYADKQMLEENIVRKHTACLMVDEETGEMLEPTTGRGTLHTPVAEPSENTMIVSSLPQNPCLVLYSISLRCRNSLF